MTGNEIVMGDMSHLGPVDPQVPYRDYGFYVSVNSMFRAKDRLDEALRTKRPNEISYPEKFMAESFDPIILEEFHGLYKTAKDHLNQILDAIYEPEPKEKIMGWPLSNLTNHSYVIDYDLAKSIGINVKHLGEYDEQKWETMRNWFSQYITEEEDRHFIKYCVPNTK